MAALPAVELPSLAGGRRAARFTKRDIKRAVEGTKAAGLQVTSVRIEPDGAIQVILGTAKSTEGAALDAADVL